MTTTITWRKPTIVDLFGYEPPSLQSEGMGEAQLGRYAEFAVCAQLSKAGYHVTHVDSIGFDIVLRTNEASYTIQVKSTSSTQNGRCRWNASTDISGSGSRSARRSRTREYKTTKRGLLPSDANLLALFHHVYETTIFIPILSEMPKGFSFLASHVERATIEESLAPALSALSKASA